MEEVKDNVFLKVNFYTKDELDSEYAKHREFVSCNSAYNYVSYVDSGSNAKVPSDYTEYVGDHEKSRGVFNQNGLLSEEQKQELKEQLQTTDSVIWDMVISFRTEFGEKYCRDYEQAFAFISTELPRFFRRCGLESDNMIWYAGLHENTENKHIHISFFEKEPLHFDDNGKLKYHSGTLPKKILLDSKIRFERKLSNATAEIIKARKDIMELYTRTISKEEFVGVSKKKLLRLYNELPKDGRIAYDSENMTYLKQEIDNLTGFILRRNLKCFNAYEEMLNAITEDSNWRTAREQSNAHNYLEDLHRRLGNSRHIIAK